MKIFVLIKTTAVISITNNINNGSQIKHNSCFVYKTLKRAREKL